MNKRQSLIVYILLAFSLLLSACGAQDVTREMPLAPTKSPEVATPAPKEINSLADGIQSDGYLHVYLIGDAEKVYTPESSFIQYITYYADCEHLIICMNGKDYVFANVGISLWDNFKSAESKGSFYNTYIRGDKYHVTDYDGENGDLIIMEYVD